MRILIVTPAGPGSRHGNRNTATRWARLLRMSGHDADIVVDAAEATRAHDLMIALHARRSAPSIALWKSNPQRPLILALTGTDLYRDIQTDASARLSMEVADAMVVLQAEGLKELAPALRTKTRVVHQSARAVRRVDPPRRSCLITVIGHLREEKDPLRAGLALRHLPDTSRIRVVQIGRELDPALGRQSRELAVADARYRWLAELPHGDAMRWLARSHAMVISSRMEGGAHVVSEAIACGVPVLASRIPGNRGLLGPDYPGYFTTGDEAELAQLMLRIERDKRFQLALERGIAQRRHLVDAEAERNALDTLVRSVAPARASRGMGD